MSLLLLEGVACVRGGRLLFEGLDLALGPGEALVVTGANGAGKSSLLRIAAGLLAPASGRVQRGGRVALADDNLALDERLPLERALRFWSRLDGRAPALDDFGLALLGDVPVRLLSTGQRKRAALARVAGSGAPIWLLDEPANGLDGEGLERLEAATEVHLASGGAILAASHQKLPIAAARELALQ